VYLCVGSFPILQRLASVNVVARSCGEIAKRRNCQEAKFLQNRKESQEMANSDDLKTAIVTLLKRNQQIGMQCDLSCYPTHDGFFFVDYILCEETVSRLNLDANERQILKDEEELVEIFDNAEEAADYYLKLTDGRIDVCSDPCHPTHNGNGKKRTLKEKALAYDKDKYF